MERVDTAGVVDPELGGEEVGEEEEARGGDDTTDQAEEDGEIRLQQNVSHGPDCHPPGQHRVLEVINVELPLGVGQGRHHEGGQDGGYDGGVGVDHGSLLWQSWRQNISLSLRMI